MRIKIDFAEANKYLGVELMIQDNIKLAGEMYNIIGDELAIIMNDDYFNGADNAVLYIGYSLDNEYFEFDLIPN